MPVEIAGATFPEPSSTEAFSALDLSAPPAAKSAPPVKGEEEDDDDDLPPRGSSWLTLLLISYSSAVTLGLLWVLLGGRRLREAEPRDVFPAVDTRPDPGRRAGRSRKAEPPPPLIAEHVTTLGKPVRIGSVEATPLEIVSGPVGLEPAIGEGEPREGGTGALKLKLRLKNISNELIFAPLDEAFLRERDTGERDSFIETTRTGQIAMYPLAVSSEWSIVGQEFRELRPGESYETVVVSSSDLGDRLTDEMTWRIRLRTGIDETDTLGVRFGKSEIRPGS